MFVLEIRWATHEHIKKFSLRLFHLNWLLYMYVSQNHRLCRFFFFFDFYFFSPPVFPPLIYFPTLFSEVYFIGRHVNIKHTHHKLVMLLFSYEFHCKLLICLGKRAFVCLLVFVFVCVKSIWWINFIYRWCISYNSIESWKKLTLSHTFEPIFSVFHQELLFIGCSEWWKHAIHDTLIMTLLWVWKCVFVLKLFLFDFCTHPFEAFV